MAVIRRGDRDLTCVIGGARSGFINETVGLGLSASAKDWRLEAFPEAADDTLAIVATDGVSDDLIPERTPPFSTWLVATIQSLSPRQRAKRVRTMLRDWPSAKHSDDKSIGIVWESTSRGHDE